LEDGRIEIFPAKAQRREEINSQLNTNGHRLKIGEMVAVAGKTSKDQRPKAKDQFDQVILTCPANIAAKICPQLTEKEKAKLKNVKYQGIVCASVLMKKSLSDFYVTNITDETPFTGIIEMSALVDKKEFGGNALVYLPKYVAPDDTLFEKTDAEIEENFVSALEKMYLHFKREDVVEFKISRVRQVFPLPTLNYSENVPSVKTSLENVFIINSAQITNGTLNVNETIQLAEKLLATEFTKNSEK
jgi:protoporphyrinogen oxidase